MNVNELLIKAQKSKSLSEEEVSLIERAYNFAKTSHQGQKRKSGENYFSHSYQAALKIADWQLDSPTIAAALLHDVAEDTSLNIDDIRKDFGEEIAFLVDGVTKIGRIKYYENNHNKISKT
ncbi:MAG: HD domain-containing protein, partial [Patescibacteria group bacterium]